MSEKALLKVFVTDLAGNFKQITFTTERLEELIQSGIAYDGSSFVGINHIQASDAILKGHKETLVECPEILCDIPGKKEYWIICSIYTTEGKPHPHCPRSTLIAMQDMLATKWEGGKLMMGCEPEAYFIERREGMGTDGGSNSNYFNPKDPKSYLVTTIHEVLDEMGFEIERSHTEVGEDQFEINWKFDTAERTADKVMFYKLVTHKVAQLHGLDVTFLPKPYPTRNGSGMHCHLSVASNGKNHFYDGKAKESLFFSKKALHFLQGILTHGRALSAIANRSEASYARLIPGFEAPCIIAAGLHNRSAVCRIPAVADTTTLSKAIRAEFRFPDPLANPYLLAAAFIAAGIDGIDTEKPFIGFTSVDFYSCTVEEIKKMKLNFLPRNLWESVICLESDTSLVKILGRDRMEAFFGILKAEVDLCQAYTNPKALTLHYLS